MDQAPKISGKRAARVHPRYDLDLPAILMTHKYEFIGLARVQNMSGGGAKLILPDPIETLPGQFVMALCSRSGPRRNCAIAWQTDNVVGVRFV